MPYHWSYDIIQCFWFKLLLKKTGLCQTDRFFFILLSDNSCINDTLIHRVGESYEETKYQHPISLSFIRDLRKDGFQSRLLSAHLASGLVRESEVRGGDDWRDWVSLWCMQSWYYLSPTTHHPPSLLVCCHNIIGRSCLKTNASSSSPPNWCQWSLQNFS